MTYLSIGTPPPTSSLILILALVLSASFTQNVNAAPFFDAKVLLTLKADPALRTTLEQTATHADSEVRVMLVFSQPLSTEQVRNLYSLGTIGTLTTHVASMHLPRTALPQLASLDFVERISLPKTLESRLDASVPEILADEVWETARDYEGNPVDGTGVVIGIVDSGIDYLHKDFYFKNGTSKILSIWDQSVTGKAPSGFDYGNECTRLDIQIKACSESDGVTNRLERGHGTAVAAVVASTGQATTLLGSCLRYDGEKWHNDTARCQDRDRTPFLLLNASIDFRYFGAHEEFNTLYFEFAAKGVYGPLKWEYSTGSGSWRHLTIDSDGTAAFDHNGTVVFTPPIDWAPDTVNGDANAYWLRLRTNTVSRPASVYRVQESPPYIGVAPGASIIAVKLIDGSEDHVLDGMSYVVEKARELGRPLVIDHSLGDALGSHDGTETLELAFADFAEDGIPIVVAAGNSRNKNLHVSGKLSPAQSVTVSWNMYENESQNYIDIWYSVSSIFAISVRTPSGRTVSGPTPDSGISTEDGSVIIIPDERPTGKEWWINVTSLGGKPLQTNPWSFTLTGVTVSDGTWDAWSEPGNFTANADSLLAKRYIIDPSNTIDTPGAAKGVITVGAYMTKYRWRSGCSICITHSQDVGLRGIWWSPYAPGVGNLTYSSSMGPTRDGRMKPDIVAPGANIATARAITRPQRFSDPDNYHQIWRGTSFSAPHVTGVIALMLQMNPHLSPSEIRATLTADARQDSFTGQIDKQNGSPLWGWGKVNALKSTQDAPELYSIRLEIASIGRDLPVNLTLDGQLLLTTWLNQTHVHILEFRRDGNHTIALTPVISIGNGTRYAVSGTPWTFSSGGIRTYRYRLQYFLRVVSEYGYATGTGWYDANSTAIVSVIPSSVPGYRFAGWSGSTNSNSTTIDLTMNSDKEIVARWEPEEATEPMPSSYVPLIVAVLVISLVAVFTLKYLRGKTKVRLRLAPQHPSEP